MTHKEKLIYMGYLRSSPFFLHKRGTDQLCVVMMLIVDKTQRKRSFNMVSLNEVDKIQRKISVDIR